MNITVKEVAEKIMLPHSKKRKEAEKMMGVSFEEMSPAQRLLAAECIAAFYDQIWG